MLTYLLPWLKRSKLLTEGVLGLPPGREGDRGRVRECVTYMVRVRRYEEIEEIWVD